MVDNSASRFGGTCAVVVGVSYLVVGATYFLMPAELRPNNVPDVFFPAYAASPLLVNIHYWALVVAALFAIGVVPAVGGLTRAPGGALVRWASALAYLGFAAMAITFLRLLAIYPVYAAHYVGGDAVTRAEIGRAAFTVVFDPHGWLMFGAVGLWLVVVNLLALGQERLSGPVATLGIALGVLNWLVVLGRILPSDLLVAIAAGLGGVILAPVWFIAVGLRLRRGAPAAAVAA